MVLNEIIEQAAGRQSVTGDHAGMGGKWPRVRGPL